MQVISTDKAPQALGPYSQAIVAGNTVYCSGQIAINPATGELVLENIGQTPRRWWRRASRGARTVSLARTFRHGRDSA